ncbi:hypothetical protein AG1IA_01544 [Rhizoctonia solani AG-1 IA]|uniref:Uncharacterized protein n=1 Tax=Thanatephorus cucumeris (strain AG1-IA) TaxID=983506 RepID=L8X289_THACA|nr:hypothetical protein AG1IA_01544 [Rhizoctonia solani AG-1 IA]
MGINLYDSIRLCRSFPDDAVTQLRLVITSLVQATKVARYPNIPTKFHSARCTDPWSFQRPIGAQSPSMTLYFRLALILRKMQTGGDIRAAIH